MGVRERIRLDRAEPSDTIEISSASSFSSMESLNMKEANMEESRERQMKSRRNMRGWLRRNRRAAVPVAQMHLKPSSTKSSRRAARLQGQLSCLPELAEDDEAPKQLDIHSFVRTTTTCFTPIVTNPRLLQEWDEELQNLVTKNTETEEMECSYDWCTDMKIKSTELNPELCYRRISKSARQRLKMPSDAHFEAIKEIEDELIEWFTAFPDSVMIKSMKSGYDRLLFHSVCRYMNLSSYSVSREDTKSEKKTYVQYNWEKFETPRVLLSDYISKLVHKNSKDEITGKKAATIQQIKEAKEDSVDLDMSGFTLID